MVLMLRFFHFHQHDFSEGDDNIHAHHDHGASAVHPLSWLGIALGLGLHSLTEGIALGGSLRVGLSHEGVGGLAGFGVFLAILSHKPLDAFSITGTMQAAGLNRRLRMLAIMIFALICPVVAFLTFWGVGLLGESGPHVMGCGLAFAAGAFLCISLSDLLPEVHFHSHDRVKLMLSFLAGGRLHIYTSLHRVRRHARGWHTGPDGVLSTIHAGRPDTGLCSYATSLPQMY